MFLRQLLSLISAHRLGDRFTRHAQRGSRGRLFEQLESRCVLSCTAVVDPLKSTLVVTGDDGANKVAIRDDGLQGIVVTCDGSVFKADQAKHVGINTLGGPDTFEVTLGDVKIDPNNPNTPLDLNLNGGGGADAFLIRLLNVAIEGDLDLTAEGGDGNDTFDLKVEDVQLTGQTGPESSPHVRLHGGNGADAFLIGLLNVVAPSGPAALHLDVTGGGGNDDVTAHVQDNSIDLHLDVDLGAGRDTFTATILPDSGVNQAGGDFLAIGCIEANVLGGAGADRFQVSVGQPNAPEPGKPQAQLSSELMLNFDGGDGADAYLIGLLNVAISGPVTLLGNGGDGNDVFMTRFVGLNGDGVWKTDFEGGSGNDTLISSISNFSPEYFVTADLGTGNDLAVISIIGPDIGQISIEDGAPPSLGIDIAGGDGRDSLFLDFRGGLLGPTRVVLDGGEGNDAIDAVLSLAFTNDYSLLAHVIGGKGNDNLALHVKVFDAGQSELDLLLDASEGRDKYRASDNVTVQKV